MKLFNIYAKRRCINSWAVPIFDFRMRELVQETMYLATGKWPPRRLRYQTR